MILACSGGSNVGQLSNQAAIELTQEGFGKMFCLAGNDSSRTVDPVPAGLSAISLPHSCDMPDTFRSGRVAVSLLPHLLPFFC